MFKEFLEEEEEERWNLRISKELPQKEAHDDNGKTAVPNLKIIYLDANGSPVATPLSLSSGRASSQSKTVLIWLQFAQPPTSTSQ
jgi:hypothetical protein